MVRCVIPGIGIIAVSEGGVASVVDVVTVEELLCGVVRCQKEGDGG